MAAKAADVTDATETAARSVVHPSPECGLRVESAGFTD